MKTGGPERGPWVRIPSLPRMDTIERFVDEFAFLSNFFPSTIFVDGVKYPTVEHAYQAHKTLNHEERQVIRETKTPGKAKQLGRSVTLREDWDDVKIDVMRTLIRLKFENPLLRELLICTNDAKLIEKNYWNDRFWGFCICRGEGQNWLGKILEEVREEIRLEMLSDIM